MAASLTPIRRIRSVCWALAASGQAAAVVHRSDMNSRRNIVPSRLRRRLVALVAHGDYRGTERIGGRRMSANGVVRPCSCPARH